jgi:hypothetical protein
MNQVHQFDQIDIIIVNLITSIQSQVGDLLIGTESKHICKGKVLGERTNEMDQKW